MSGLGPCSNLSHIVSRTYLCKISKRSCMVLSGEVQKHVKDYQVQFSHEIRFVHKKDILFVCCHPVHCRGCINGRYAQVNVAIDSKVDLTISFQNSVTQEPVSLNKFMLSFHDIDQFGSLNEGGDKLLVFLSECHLRARHPTPARR